MTIRPANPSDARGIAEAQVRAWQVAYRFDQVDLTDSGIAGGKQTIHTFGVNWHWNPHTRVMFNVMFANIQDNDTNDQNVTSFITRFQFDF